MRNRKQEVEGRGCRNARRIAVGIVITAVALVGINLAALAIFNDKAVLERATMGLARDYYENYFYDKVPTDSFGDYAETGFPSASLRVLLSWAKREGREIDPIFDKVKCNAMQTVATFYPIEPYGASDYRIDVNYTCNFK